MTLILPAADARLTHVPGLLARRILHLWPLKLLDRLVSRSNPRDAPTRSVELLLHELAANGELELLQNWSRPVHIPPVLWPTFKPDSFATAALNGHAHVVQWFLSGGTSDKVLAEITPELVKQVAALGFDEVVKLLRPYAPTPASIFPCPCSQNSETEQTPTASDAVEQVFLSPTLLSHIYSFQSQLTREIVNGLQRSYRGIKDENQVEGLLMRIAIIQGDWDGLKLVSFAGGLKRFASTPKWSLSSAMHDAAVEGRLDMLQWLHAHTKLRCRPHTMASAVRAGWVDIVRWLHENAPESKASMSYAPLVDASYWGFLDVLRVVHELRIVDDTQWAQKVLDTAVIRNHVDIVRWLLGQFVLCASPSSIEETIMDGNIDMLRALHKRNALNTKGVDVGTSRAASKQALSALVEYAVTHQLLSFTGANQVVERIAQMEDNDAKQAMWRALIAAYPTCIDAMIDVAIRHDNDVLLAAVLEGDSITPHLLTHGFRLAATERASNTLATLISRQVYTFCEDALPLTASFGRVDYVQMAFPFRSQASAIAAIQQAENREIASFLLAAETQFYTEAALLENISACVSPCFARYILNHGRQDDKHQPQSFASVLEEANSPLSLGEVNAIRIRQDPELDAFIKQYYQMLASPLTTASTPSSPLWLEIHKYLHSLGIDFPPTTLQAAITRGRTDEVQWLLASTNLVHQTIETSSVREAASQSTHFEALKILVHHDLTSSIHELRLGIRLAYEDAINTSDPLVIARLQLLGADDVKQLKLVLVAKEGHTNVAARIAAIASDDEVVEAITVATERLHFSLVTMLLEARSNLQWEMAVRLRLAGIASINGDIALGQKLMGISAAKRPKSKKRHSFTSSIMPKPTKKHRMDIALSVESK